MTASKRELFMRLCAVTRKWNQTDAVPDYQQKECGEIGVLLHAMGGEALMREAYYMAKNLNQYVCVIQAYWDGIGEWQW